jgi:hypothetical protein
LACAWIDRPVTTTNNDDKTEPENWTCLEREAGIEPASLAWKARVLPLNYSRCAWSLVELELDLNNFTSCVVCFTYFRR